MRLPNDPNKFTSQFKYVEVARWIADLKKVAREQERDTKVPILIPWNEAEAFAKKHGNVGIYTSVSQYDKPNLEEAAALSSLYFDLDSPDLELSLSDTVKLVTYLLKYIPSNAIVVYFSGGKGFHVECEAIALGVSTSDDLSKVYNFIAKDLASKLKLSTLDFQVYDLRRMWRLPNSQHQKTGLFKVNCTDLIIGGGVTIEQLKQWASQPRSVDVPEQVFNATANRWYREYTYALEASKKEKANIDDIMSRFMENGAGSVKSFDDQDKVFDKFKLFKNCPAVRQLQDKAIANHHLDHYERLFLCSLLTYTPDAVRYLHEILSECSDYNFEISNSHLDDWIKRREYEIGGRPFTCEKAAHVGIMCSGCDTIEPRKKVIRLNDNKFLETDEYSSPSPVRFCYSYMK